MVLIRIKSLVSVVFFTILTTVLIIVAIALSASPADRKMNKYDSCLHWANTHQVAGEICEPLIGS